MIHTVTLDRGALKIGQRCSGFSIGTLDKGTEPVEAYRTVWEGTFDGFGDSEGTTYAYFTDGRIGFVPQKRFGFPAGDFALTGRDDTNEDGTVVQRLMRALTDKGITNDWHHTGGGCYAVHVPAPDGGMLLVTDIEDVYGAADLDSDEQVFGFYVGQYDADGEYIEGDVYASQPGAEGYTVGGDIPQCVAAIAAALAERSAALV